jgi:hypothetical protein
MATSDLIAEVKFIVVKIFCCMLASSAFCLLNLCSEGIGVKQRCGNDVRRLQCRVSLCSAAAALLDFLFGSLSAYLCLLKLIGSSLRVI